jgi:UDP-N-acetylmuramate--alanine ligase
VSVGLTSHDPLILLDVARLRLRGFVHPEPARIAVVCVAEQRLYLFEDGRSTRSYVVSTAERGVGGEEDSLRTPPGTHVVDRRIGDGAGEGTVFVSREPTGTIWAGEECEDDLILTRVITLDGCELGINRGPGCDSKSRFIYLHGTNHETALGRPTSHGCVRLANRDVIDLCDRLREGDAVVIL